MRLAVRLLFGVGLAWISHGVCPLAASPAAAAPSQYEASQEELQGRLIKLATALGQSPVNARVDRVWRAIPGLSGWSLNVAASVRETTRLHDQQLHLVWQQVAPSTALKDLPPEPVYRGPDAEKSLSLMFNVSWGEEYIPSILKTLQKHHVRATFFLDGAWVQKHPSLAKEIGESGHAIGSHGSGHPDFRELDMASLERQVSATNQVIQQATGKVPDLIAPPAGSYDKRCVGVAHRHGLYTILWTTDTVDWRRPPASVIVERATNRIANGSLVLMHPTAPTAEALPTIIANLQNRGYSFKTVDDVVKERPVVIPPVVLSKRP